VTKITELEVVARSQVDKIAELEVTCGDLKCEKDKVTDGYRRLAKKHKSLAKKVEQEKIELVEAHDAELTQPCTDLALETCSYIEYHQNVCHRLCEIH
jgi:predicted nuclease with TOPRIM domain